MANLNRDGYAYISDNVSVEGIPRIKLSADAPKLIIGVPIRSTINEACENGSLVTTARTIAPEFMFSMLQNVVPINVTAKYRVVRGMMGGPARDDIVQYAIREKAKYIMFLDDDVLFPNYTFSRLYQRMEMYPDIGLLTGVYCSNKMGYSEPLLYKDYGEGAFWDFELNELYDIYACGAGCMMVRVDALKAVKSPWFFEDVRKLDGPASTVIGHDVMVCRRMWEETKYRVCVDTGILCGHLDIHRGIIHILPKDAPAYKASRGKRYFDSMIQNGNLFWMEHLPEVVKPVEKEELKVEDKPKKKLLAITTCGDGGYAVEALVARAGAFEIFADWDTLIIFDGKAPETLRQYCTSKNIKLLEKDTAKGLTDSWNVAYQRLKDDYDICCISNDDVRFAPNSLRHMERGLENFAVVGPVSNMPGHQPAQQVRTLASLNGADVKDVGAIEQQLAGLRPHARLPYVNGFCFMFDRRMLEHEFSEGLLFDPKNINVGNEDEWQRRLVQKQVPIGMALNSYVWHEKAAVLNQNTDAGRNRLWNQPLEIEEKK